jgi:hypothetical protein
MAGRWVYAHWIVTDAVGRLESTNIAKVRLTFNRDGETRCSVTSLFISTLINNNTWDQFRLFIFGEGMCSGVWSKPLPKMF